MNPETINLIDRLAAKLGTTAENVIQVNTQANINTASVLLGTCITAFAVALVGFLKTYKSEKSGGYIPDPHLSVICVSVMIVSAFLVPPCIIGLLNAKANATCEVIRLLTR